MSRFGKLLDSITEKHGALNIYIKNCTCIISLNQLQTYKHYEMCVEISFLKTASFVTE
jgi:hypothetical protein